MLRNVFRRWMVIPVVAVAMAASVGLPMTFAAERVFCLGHVPSNCHLVRHYRCNTCSTGTCWVFDCR